MRYLLDTNAWIHYLKHATSPVEARLRETPAHEVAACSVVWAELLYGARNIRSAGHSVSATRSKREEIQFHETGETQYRRIQRQR